MLLHPLLGAGLGYAVAFQVAEAALRHLYAAAGGQELVAEAMGLLLKVLANPDKRPREVVLKEAARVLAEHLKERLQGL